MRFYSASVIPREDLALGGQSVQEVSKNVRRQMGMRQQGKISNSKDSLVTWLAGFSDEKYHKVGPHKWRPKKKRKRLSARAQKLKKKYGLVIGP